MSSKSNFSDHQTLPAHLNPTTSHCFSQHFLLFKVSPSSVVCFQPPAAQLEDDSVVSTLLFSNSDSPEPSTTSSTSSSSSYHSPSSSHVVVHHPSNNTATTYTLTVKALSHTISPPHSLPVSFFCCPWKKPKPISILKGVSFTAKSSEILAVVGPSGTGKSTLLRIISGRVRNEEFDPKMSSSTILLNNRLVTSPDQLRKICGFVAQEDNLLPLLTVKETLIFSAKFRLREMRVKEEREERVDRLMKELGLVHVADSFVGDEENRGISGGERKRVSIGVDMIHDPPVLLLDEPTSGLDSSSALQVIDLLSSMAKAKHRTIILSIHQPSYRILQHMSKFLILSRGSVVHFGNLESLEEKIDKMGFRIPLQLNPLEFAMEIIYSLEDSNHRERAGEEQGEEEDKQLPSSSPAWPREEEAEWINDQKQNKVSHAGMMMMTTISNHFLEIMFLCSRFWKIIYRTKQLFLARTMQAVVGGFGLGSVYMNVRKDEGGITERLGLFAFSLSFLLSSTVEALPIYLQERRVLMKEASRGAYRISSYMIANTIIFLPFLFAVAILFAVPVYWLVGLNPSLAAFTFFTFLVWVIVLMASSLVLFLSAVSPDFISGNSLICTVLGAFFLFSGYFIPKESIPSYWIFMYYVSLYRYPLDSLLINEYWSLRDECFSWKHQDQDQNQNQNPLSKCLMTGNDVLMSRGLDKDSRWMNVGIMFGFFLFYRLVCWIVLVRRASKTTV